MDFNIVKIIYYSTLFVVLVSLRDTVLQAVLRFAEAKLSQAATASL